MTTDKFTATSDNTIYQFNWGVGLYFETIIPSTTTLTEARWVHKDSGGNILNSPGYPTFGSLGNLIRSWFFLCRWYCKYYFKC